MSVHRKLMQARIALQGRKMNKSGLNKFAGYSYFELGDFLPSVMDIFNEIGLCGVISFGTDVATLTITDVDGGGEIVITSPMAEAQLKGCHPVQNLGATETYIRRYLWVTAMEVVEHDALDATLGKGDKKIIHTPTQGAVIPDDEKPYLNDLAQVITSKIKVDNDPVAAVRMLQAENLETEQRVYFWSLLPSDVRSRIKKQGLTNNGDA